MSVTVCFCVYQLCLYSQHGMFCHLVGISLKTRKLVPVARNGIRDESGEDIFMQIME